MITPHRLIRQSRQYPLLVGSDLIRSLDAVARQLDESAPYFVIVSKRVAELHGAALRAGAYESFATIEVSDSESAKTLATVEALVTEMLEARVRRDAIAFVVGGGVVGDCAGFACSVYLRGIRFVQVPTTLLAQVDSSIGGKVAVNHFLGKNMIGAFAPPLAVVSDLDVLSTLPQVEFVSGLYESLKSGVIGDSRLFSIVSEQGIALQRDVRLLREVVVRSADVKADIVERDEREDGDRRLLNYGHTFGHGIEVALDYRGLSHGEAVAWGMVAANAVAMQRGILSAAEGKAIDDAVLRLGVRPIGAIDPEAIFRGAALDKKFSSRGKVLVLPTRIGQCVVVEDATDEEIRFGIETMLARSG